MTVAGFSLGNRVVRGNDMHVALPAQIQRASPANGQMPAAQAVAVLAQLLALKAQSGRRTALQRHGLILPSADQVHTATCWQA
ncbi:hypothetical protein D3C76_1672890 [compost metagenome]